MATHDAMAMALAEACLCVHVPAWREGHICSRAHTYLLELKGRDGAALVDVKVAEGILQELVPAQANAEGASTVL